MSETSQHPTSQNPKHPNPPNGKRPSLLNSYAAYSGLVFQMAAFVVGGWLVAKLIGRALHTGASWVMMAGLLAGVISALVFAIRYILKREKES